ncbi:MAG TPA: GGDEF domain-containing protein [Firmicutes bacterium]|nr:GGDEF domain-containing protein [Candidatus Fermentithermobacillaceae bacterium]
MNRPAGQFSKPRLTGDSGHTQKLKGPGPVNCLITTNLKGRDALPQIAYFLAFAAVGVPLCIKTILAKPLPEPRTAMFLLVLGLISYHIPITLPSNVQFHPGFPLLMSALFCHGISAAILVILPSMSIYWLTKKRGICNCVFNISQFALCLYAAKTIGLRTGWKQGAPAANGDLLPICLMILAFDILNILFVCGSRSIETKESFWECFLKLLYTERKAVLPQRTFMTIVAMLLSSHMGNIAFVIVFIGVISLRFQNLFQRELVEKTEEAEIDSLTNLHNMRYLHRWMSTEIGAMAETENPCSFIFADIDGLKEVNDAYGHETGNDLLVHVAEILVGNVRSKDRVARYGGDEFVVACPGTSLTQAVSIAMRALQASRNKPFAADGIEIAFGLSIGVASWPEHGETVFDSIRMADKAMYLAKRDGGNTVRTAAEL